MTRLDVFDPPMCCSTGVCGVDVDPRLAQFAADLEWLSKREIQVARYNLAQDPAAFANNAAVRDLLGRWGSSCLPLLVLDQKIATRGRYPSRVQLATMARVAEETT